MLSSDDLNCSLNVSHDDDESRIAHSCDDEEEMEVSYSGEGEKAEDSDTDEYCTLSPELAETNTHFYDAEDTINIAYDGGDEMDDREMELWVRLRGRVACRNVKRALRPKVVFIPSIRVTILTNFLHCCFCLMSTPLDVAAFILNNLGQDGVFDAYGRLHIQGHHSVEEIKDILIAFFRQFTQA